MVSISVSREEMAGCVVHNGSRASYYRRLLINLRAQGNLLMPAAVSEQSDQSEPSISQKRRGHTNHRSIPNSSRVQHRRRGLRS